MINVFLDDSHVPGSPFKFTARGLETSPGHVTAQGGGLVTGHVGEETSFTVTRTQPGALTLSIDGPAKVIS